MRLKQLVRLQEVSRYLTRKEFEITCGASRQDI